MQFYSVTANFAKEKKNTCSFAQFTVHTYTQSIIQKQETETVKQFRKINKINIH